MLADDVVLLIGVVTKVKCGDAATSGLRKWTGLGEGSVWDCKLTI